MAVAIEGFSVVARPIRAGVLFDAMNPVRLHNHESFFKHTTVHAAKAILAAGKLRWSAPSRFNDPFDVPQVIFDGIDEDRLRDSVAERMKALVESPILPNPQHHRPEIATLLRLFSRTASATKRELIASIEEEHRNPTNPLTGLKLLQDQWHLMHKEQRILCLTERWESASMWDRYSDGHKGVLLEFGCIDELDSAWFLAKPVQYVDGPLRLNTAEGLADLMLYDIDFGVKTLMHQYTHTKTTDWAYEKEWRVASWKRAHENGDFSDYGFSPEELRAIYFGAKIADSDREVLTGLVKTRYLHANLRQMVIQGGRYLVHRSL